MILRLAWLTPLAVLAGCSEPEERAPERSAATFEAPLALASPSATAAPQPDLAACPKSHANEDRARVRPLAIPAAFGDRARSDIDRLAVVADEGDTVCIDTSWIEEISRARTLGKDRFFAFAWEGYESFGYVVVDRSGKGQVIDTGNAPVSPPSGKRLAAVDLGEAGFGSLNAFAVWEVRPIGLRQIARVADGLPSGDWRVDGWRGEDCVGLSLLPSDRMPENYDDLPKVPRDRWFAAEQNGWRPTPGSCPTA